MGRWFVFWPQRQLGSNSRQEMNERVKKFALECGAWNQVYGDQNFRIKETFDVEKFAQLIVQECALIADTERSNSVGCGYITKTNGMRIKEHLGVES